jgi:hypothetical protein
MPPSAVSEITGARIGPSVPRKTIPSSARSSGNRFIGGVPMNLAAKLVAG